VAVEWYARSTMLAERARNQQGAGRGRSLNSGGDFPPPRRASAFGRARAFERERNAMNMQDFVVELHGFQALRECAALRLDAATRHPKPLTFIAAATRRKMRIDLRRGANWWASSQWQKNLPTPVVS
jgi:hypothetical protein